MEKQALLDGFQKVFHRPGKDIFFSPGRINLIGEHTDYNAVSYTHLTLPTILLV